MFPTAHSSLIFSVLILPLTSAQLYWLWPPSLYWEKLKFNYSGSFYNENRYIKTRLKCSHYTNPGYHTHCVRVEIQWPNSGTWIGLFHRPPGWPWGSHLTILWLCFPCKIGLRVYPPHRAVVKIKWLAFAVVSGVLQALNKYKQFLWSHFDLTVVCIIRELCKPQSFINTGNAATRQYNAWRPLFSSLLNGWASFRCFFNVEYSKAPSLTLWPHDSLRTYLHGGFNDDIKVNDFKYRSTTLKYIP